MSSKFPPQFSLLGLRSRESPQEWDLRPPVAPFLNQRLTEQNKTKTSINNIAIKAHNDHCNHGHSHNFHYTKIETTDKRNNSHRERVLLNTRILPMMNTFLYISIYIQMQQWIFSIIRNIWGNYFKQKRHRSLDRHRILTRQGHFAVSVALSVKRPV